MTAACYVRLFPRSDGDICSKEVILAFPQGLRGPGLVACWGRCA